MLLTSNFRDAEAAIRCNCEAQLVGHDRFADKAAIRTVNLKVWCGTKLVIPHRRSGGVALQE